MRIIAKILSFVEPADEFIGTSQERRFRLLVILLSLLMTTTLIGYLFSSNNRLLIGAIILIPAVFLSRTRYFQISVFLTILALLAPSYIIILTEELHDSDNSIISAAIWIPLALVFGGIWLRYWGNLIVTASVVASLGAVIVYTPWVTDKAPGSPIVQLVSLIFVIGVLTSYAAYQREKILTELIINK